MDPAWAERYAVLEERHPWFVARRELFCALAAGREHGRVLDVGCGTGMLLAELERRGFGHLEGVEPDAALRARVRRPGLALHEALPDGTFDTVFMLDVLEHIEDDSGTLRRVHGMLAPGGRLFVSVPAHPFLWSAHDEVNHHVRRYRRDELSARLREAGLRVARLTYWNAALFVPLAVLRRLGLGGRARELELSPGPGSALWLRLLRLENALVPRTGLPIGVSLVAVADREERQGTGEKAGDRPAPGPERPS